MAAMGKTWVEMKTSRVETGWVYAAPAVLNSLVTLIKNSSALFKDPSKWMPWNYKTNES
jgi:hypothetical protein